MNSFSKTLNGFSKTLSHDAEQDGSPLWLGTHKISFREALRMIREMGCDAHELEETTLTFYCVDHLCSQPYDNTEGLDEESPIYHQFSFECHTQSQCERIVEFIYG